MKNAFEILNQVTSILKGERNRTHGDYHECFGLVCVFWTLYLTHRKNIKITLEKSDIAMMMMFLKMARQTVGEGDIDHFIDTIGYSAFGAEFFSNESS